MLEKNSFYNNFALDPSDFLMFTFVKYYSLHLRTYSPKNLITFGSLFWDAWM
jgi:hypothetical protein